MSVTKLQEKANHFKIKPLLQNNSIGILSINETKLDEAINDSENYVWKLKNPDPNHLSLWRGTGHLTF